MGMVFIVCQKYQEFPGKWNREVINIGVSDGFKVSYCDDDPDKICLYSTQGGMDRFVCEVNTQEDATSVCEQIMRSHVNNEAHMVVDVEDYFVSDVAESIGKDEFIEIMLGILEKLGYGELTEQYKIMDADGWMDEVVDDDPIENVDDDMDNNDDQIGGDMSND